MCARERGRVSARKRESERTVIGSEELLHKKNASRTFFPTSELMGF